MFGFGLFDVSHPGKQFFSHVGTEPPLPGYYQYFGGKYVLLKDKIKLCWQWNSVPLLHRFEN